MAKELQYLSVRSFVANLNEIYEISINVFGQSLLQPAYFMPTVGPNTLFQDLTLTRRASTTLTYVISKMGPFLSYVGDV